MPTTVRIWVSSKITFARHSDRLLENCPRMNIINKIIENRKKTVPKAELPQGIIDSGGTPNNSGWSRIACAMRDDTPAVIKRVFLSESRDMIFKRIAQKRFFFYRPAIHDKRSSLRLLSTLKVLTECYKP